MLLIATIIFFIAAIFNFLILKDILGNELPLKRTVYTHGALEILGLLLLIIYMIVNKSWSPIVSLILILLAGSTGLRLLTFKRKTKPTAKWLAIVHFMAEVLAVILLMMVVIMQGTNS